MEKLARWNIWTHAHADIFLDLIRIYVGLGLMLKGFYFMFRNDELIELVQQPGTYWFAGAVVAHYIIVAHVLGGFFLMIGLLTRIAAMIQIPILLGAVFFVNLPRVTTMTGRQDVEFSALVLFLLVVLFAFGSGQWAVDRYLERKVAMLPEEQYPRFPRASSHHA